MAVAPANLTAIALCLLIAAASSSAAAAFFAKHTVGGDSGWFFNETTNATSANYSAWAASQTFDFGDYLLFNTYTNLSVIHTYNLTTYQACNVDGASSNDTFKYGGFSDQFVVPLAVAVSLTLEGPTYFFSDADDGVQCENGMRFEIDVKRGSGLLPSLDQPPPPPHAASTPPVTVVNAPGNVGSRGGVNAREAAWGIALLSATLFF